MKLCLLILVLVACVNADCGCLKCSRHLQGVDVPGPAGPLKVIFRRHKPSGSGCGCCCGCKIPNEPSPNKVPELCNIGTTGGQYSATVQLPLPKLPKPRLPLRNLKYRTDTILVPPPPLVAPTEPPCAAKPASLTTADILKWLRDVETANNVASQQQLLQQQQQQQPFPTVVAPQLTVETAPCEYHQCRGNLQLEARSFNTANDPPQCPYCQRPKRGAPPQENSSADEKDKVISSSVHSERSKRDLAKRGYDFFMNMLPQSIREPLHHSVQGSNYLQQSKPKTTLKEKLIGLKMTKPPGVSETLHHQHKPQHSLPLRTSIFNQPSKAVYGHKSLVQQKPFKYPFLGQRSEHVPSFHLNGKPKESWPQQTDTYGSAKRNPKLSLLNQEDSLANQKYSTSETKLKLFGKSKGSSASRSVVTVDPLMDNKYKMFLRKYGSHGHGTAPVTPPKLAQRVEEREGGADEKALLKKLKKLNNNPFAANIEDQATAFVQQLLKPETSKRRNRRSSEDHARKKRTIILGSDEIDLPAHYEIEMVSVEDESEENTPEEISPFQEFEEEEPIVGLSPFRRQFDPSRRFYPSLPSLQPKPEIVLGKNVIQKAVRDELEAHHRKLEREQKMKEMRENLKRKKQQSVVPQNPIFALLTAPMKFLKHFHDLNRGVSPVISTIPKLVYSTKKVFRDLGKNFQRNCLDLASNVIGDFDQIHPTIIQHITEPDGRRYRREVLGAELKKCWEANQDEIVNTQGKNDILKENKDLNSEDQESSEEILDKVDYNMNKTEKLIAQGGKMNEEVIKKENKLFFSSHKNLSQSNSVANNTQITPNNTGDKNSTPAIDFLNNNKDMLDQASVTTKKTLNNQLATNQFTPDYTLAFKNSEETTNFRKAPDEHVRKKRYVVRVVDDDAIQDQVEDYLHQKLGSQHDYLNPLQDYYDKVNSFLNKLYSSHQPLCQIGDDCYYQRSAPAEVEETYYDYQHEVPLETVEESSEEKPRKKKIQIRKTKPRVIIDNKGRPFMEHNGYKRPLLLNGKKFGKVKKTSQTFSGGSSEETGNKISTLIARAKGDSEVVGNSHKDIVPHQIVKSRISSLLEEIDQLVHFNAENYDGIFEDMIKIEHIKISIEQDWKRMLIEERADDIRAKIGLLSKFKELQHLKDGNVRKIAAALKKNDNEFVRCQLVNCLKRLHKLQNLITSVVEDFEQHLKMRTSFDTKKEIKYVDYLADLKFASAKTRNDLLKMLCKDRDSEGLKNMDMLHKLKNLLTSADEDPEKFEQAAKLLWELKNLEKLQIETINDMNKKLARHLKIKKELKILFDLQRRFEDCNKELSEFLGDVKVKGKANTIGQKKDIKEVIAEVKKRHEEMLQKAKERSSNLLKKS